LPLQARSVDDRGVRLEDPEFATILNLEANPIGLAALRVVDRHVGNGDAGFLLNDAALLPDVRVGLGVALHHVHAGDDQLTVLQDAVDLAALALVAAGNHDYLIITLQLLHVASLNLLTCSRPRPARGLPFAVRRRTGASPTAQSTSGAREMMRMNFSVRSSRVTGPNTRVPIGACWLFSRMAALSSKRISDPSWRRTPLLVRTTSAFSTWPFLTLPRGMASLTVTLITSPMRA